MGNRRPNLETLQRRAPPPEPEVDQLGAIVRQLRHGLDPVVWAAEELGFVADEWQAELLRWTGRKLILNIARQQGKSTTSAIKGLHRAIFAPGSLILLVAPSVQQTTELRKKIDGCLKAMRRPPALVVDNSRTLEFDNASRIVLVAADQDTVRGYSAVSLIIEDESAFVPDDVFEAMEPMLLVSLGQHLLMSTPNGYTGHFPDIWHKASDAEWKKLQVTSWDNPRTTHAELRRIRDEKERLGQLWKFRQEYECSFLAAAQGLVYPHEMGSLERPGKNAAPALDRDPRLGWQYVLGIDYGFSDSTAFVVLGWQPHDPNVYVVESFKRSGLTPAEAAEVALGLTKRYPFARMVGDVGGLGKGYVEEARRRYRLPIEAAAKQNKRGYIELLVGDLRAGLMRVMPGNDDLLKEWSTLPWDELRELPADGYEDHLSDACLYAWRATYAFLETVRIAGPEKGTPEALAAEADEMLEQRIADAQKAQGEWWDTEETTPWRVNESSAWMN